MDETPPIEDYQDVFARVEREVEAGSTDLAGLGFWRLVEDVKRDPALAHHWAEIVGRIDRKAFERRTRVRLPVWLGNLVLLAGTLAVLAATEVGLRVAEGRIGDPNPTLGGILIVIAAAGLSVTAHDPAHWLVGGLGRIRFSHYFFDGPMRIEPGIKIDYASYMRASPSSRAWMHAAGAVASKLAPFAVFGWAYAEHAERNWELLPEWSLWAILAYGVGQIVTDALHSIRHGDWKKVRRERRVARFQAGSRP